MLWNFEIRHLDGTGNHSEARGVFRDENPDYARNRASRISANAADFRMCIRRAHQSAIEHARELEVIGVMRNALDQARVFLALEFAAHPVGSFGVSIGLSVASRSGSGFSVACHGLPRCRRAGRDALRHLAGRRPSGMDDVLTASAEATIAFNE